MSPIERVNELARQIVETNPDIETCVDTVLAQLGEASQELVRQSVRLAVQQAVYTARTRQRIVPIGKPAIGAPEQAATSGVFQRSLLDSWYVGNRRLGDCTAKELTAEAGRLNAQAGGLVRHAMFYNRLAEKVGGLPVRATLDDQQVAAIFENITKLGESEAA